MPKIIDYTLTTEELQQVQKALSTDPDGRVRSRAQAIHLLHLGSTHKEVANVLHTTVTTVYNWHERWRNDGIDGLYDKKRTGRPKKGGAEFNIKLEEVVETNPSELGYGFSVWTLQRLIDHMAKVTDVTVSNVTMLKRLAELDLVYRRPKHDLGNLQDKEAKEQAENMIIELKKKQKQEKSNYSLWTKRP